MEKVRVLIVDDAVLARKVIADSLSNDPDIEVVGTASNGRLALQRLDSNPSDLLILDLEMPEMDGLATIDAVRAKYPTMPILMCSAFTVEGADRTLEALTRGANDYITKPSKARDLEDAKERLRSELVPKIRALCAAPQEPNSIAPRGTGSIPTISIDAVAIGSSTGGPSALAAVLPQRDRGGARAHPPTRSCLHRSRRLPHGGSTRRWRYNTRTQRGAPRELVPSVSRRDAPLDSVSVWRTCPEPHPHRHGSRWAPRQRARPCPRRDRARARPRLKHRLGNARRCVRGGRRSRRCSTR